MDLTYHTYLLIKCTCSFCFWIMQVFVCL